MSVNKTKTPMGINAADLAAYVAKRSEEEIKTELQDFIKELGAAITSSSREVMMIHKELAAIHNVRCRLDFQIKLGDNYMTALRCGFGPGCDEEFVRNGCKSGHDSGYESPLDALLSMKDIIDTEDSNNENDC